MDAILRRLPPFRGKARLAKLFCKNTIRSQRDILIKGKYNCSYILPNLLETISFEIFINGIYEQETSDFICKKVPKGGTFLDLGANIGAISIPVFTKRNDINVVCVEAAPWLTDYLKKNFKLNNISNVNIINRALFNKDNEELDFYSPQEKFGKGSLSPVFTNKGVKVKTITLDSLLNKLNVTKVDLIKIDVEGYEFHVFQGGESILKSTDAPDILFEFVDWAETKAGLSAGAAQSLLIDLGYTIFDIDAGGKLHARSESLKQGSKILLASKKNQ